MIPGRPVRLVVPETLRATTPEVSSPNTPAPVTVRLLVAPVTPPVKVTVVPAKVRVVGLKVSQEGRTPPDARVAE
jgi:hypothetical protein